MRRYWFSKRLFYYVAFSVRIFSAAFWYEIFEVMDLTYASAGFRIVPFVCEQSCGALKGIRFSGTSIYYVPQ